LDTTNVLRKFMSLFSRLKTNQGDYHHFCTHEQEIATFSTRTIVLKDGNIIQIIKTIKGNNRQEEQLAKLPKEGHNYETIKFI